MFKVGDIIRGLRGNGYGTTTVHALMLVNTIDTSSIGMRATVVASKTNSSEIGNSFSYLEQVKFRLATKEDFKEFGYSHKPKKQIANWSLR